MKPAFSTNQSSATRLLTACAILFLSLTPCGAQRNLPAKVNEFLNSEMHQQRIPGMSVAIIQNGRMIFVKGYGLANVEHRVAVRPETIFQSGSIGKQFTATAVMMLVDEGRLSVDDNLSKYFPDAPDVWKKITLRHLLTHTSGMTDYPADFNLRRDYSEEELLAIIKSQPLAFQPGARWSYSNLGYVTLGILISKVTGKFYGDYLSERIFKPFGMTKARVISEADIVPNRASGYRLVNNELKNQEWVAPQVNTTADGSLYLTVLDMAKWDAALSSDKLLKRSSLELMRSSAKLSNGSAAAYGFGWHTGAAHQRRLIFHGGAWQGFKSFIVRVPDEKLTIVLFANLSQAREFRLARGLLATIYPEFALPPDKVIEDREPKVTALVEKLLTELIVGKVDVDLFTAEARMDLLTERAATILEHLNSLSHPVAIVHSLELIQRRDEGEQRIYRYALSDLGRTLYCTVSLTRRDRVAALKLGME